MDYPSAPLRFTSRLDPDVTFMLNPPTKRTAAVAARVATSHATNRFDIQEEDMSVGLIKSYVRDFEGVTLDGKKPTIEALTLDGPLGLVNELIEEIGRISRPLPVTDSADEQIIADCERQIREARARVERRKNSAPASSPATTDAGTQIAGSASGIAQNLDGYALSEIATAHPV